MAIDVIWIVSVFYLLICFILFDDSRLSSMMMNKTKITFSPIKNIHGCGFGFHDCCLPIHFFSNLIRDSTEICITILLNFRLIRCHCLVETSSVSSCDFSDRWYYNPERDSCIKMFLAKLPIIQNIQTRDIYMLIWWTATTQVSLKTNQMKLMSCFSSAIWRQPFSMLADDTYLILTHPTFQKKSSNCQQELCNLQRSCGLLSENDNL